MLSTFFFLTFALVTVFLLQHVIQESLERR